MKRIALTILAFVACSFAQAKVTLPSYLSSDMVLQQQSDVEIWGTTNARAVKVSASWDGKSYSAKTGQDGRWSVKVHTPVAGGPYDVRITDGDVTVLSNILVGEVWFCSGQSNMEMPVQGF